MKKIANTYHSVRDYVNDKILENGFQYGYDDQFFQTAGQLFDVVEVAWHIFCNGC